MISLEERYNSHELPKSIKELFISDDAVAIYLTENCKRLIKQQKKNQRQMIVNKVAQKIMFSEKEVFQSDEEFLNELDDLISSSTSMLSSLFTVLKEDNYLEIGRFIDFILVLFSDNYQVIQSKRRALSFNKRGIQFFDNRYQDTREDIKEFFDKEFDKFKREKVLEKKIKM